MALSRVVYGLCFVVASVVACTDDGEPGQACNDPSACAPLATIKVDLPPTLTFTDLQQSTVTVCRNDICLTGAFSAINAPPSPNTGVVVPIASGPDGGKTVGASTFVMATANGAFWLQVFWPLGLGGAPADGDKYKLTVKNGTGAEIVSPPEDTVTTYDVTYPFGKECPTMCSHVVFDHHTS
jgi:hypothetical protein